MNKKKCEDVKMTFGRYNGQSLGQILADNPAYLDYLNGCDLSGDLLEAVAEMNVKYAAEIERAIELGSD
jgi:hypothetical protein